MAPASTDRGRLPRALLLLALALAFAAAPARAQVVRGTLLDEMKEPIAGATVTLVNDRGYTRTAVTTDSTGAFDIRAPASGAFWLRAEPVGYAPVLSRPFLLERETVLEVSLETSRRVVALEGVTGMSRRQNRNFAGFLDRQRFGFGTRYLGPEELARRRAATVADLLMGLAPGLDAVPHGDILFRNRGRNCSPILVVDGVRYSNVPVDQVVMASTVRAVEVYMQPEFAPAQLTMAPFNSCGAVALWTHHGLGIE